jgi:hypothetical protein
MKGDIALKIKGKYFVPPSEFNLSLNELMQLALDCGTGRPVPRDGCVQTKWTPSLLATAITEIDQNSEGVDIRTVQLWFQDNDRGIGQTNLRWLSWVFGCGDPVASRDWMVALSAAKTRTNNSRKNNPTILSLPNANEGATDTLEAETGKSNVATKSKRGFSLARWSETLFSGSPLDLPTAIFAGAVALGLSSYLLGIHNLTIGNSDDLLKQLGFMWAPNWTLLFMVFMPLFFAFIIELVVFWKDEGRLKFLVEADQADSDGGWTHKVESLDSNIKCNG